MFRGGQSRIMARAIRFGVSGLLTIAALGGIEAAQAGSYTNFGAFTANDRSIWSNGAAYVLDTGPQFVGATWDAGGSLGDKACALGACIGAIVTAETSGRFGFDYGLKINSGSFDVQYPFQATFTTPTSYFGGNIGNLTIGSSFAGIGPSSTLQVNGPSFQAYLDLAAKFHAYAGAEICVGPCFNPSIGLDFDASTKLININKNGDGKLILYGQEIIGGQPSSALGGFLHASLDKPNFDSSSTSTPGGFANNVLTSTSRSQVMSLTADLVNIAFDSASVPGVPSGEDGGFGFTYLEAVAGLSLDVQQTLKFTPEFKGAYVFSQQVAPVVNGIAQPLTNMINFDLGDDVTFAPGQVGSISYMPIIYMGGTISNTIDLILNGSFDLAAFGLDIADISLGPLFDYSTSGQLGSLRVYDTSFETSFGGMSWAPITMDFTACEGPTYGEFQQHLICGHSGFNKTTTGPDSDGLFYDLLNAFQCDPTKPLVSPHCVAGGAQGLQSGPYLDTIFGRIYVNDSSFADFDQLVAPPQSSDANQDALLDGLGRFAPQSFVIPEGRSYASYAPEPATWAMLVGGFGLIGWSMRRRARASLAAPVAA
jgi:hypothetical protein